MLIYIYILYNILNHKCIYREYNNFYYIFKQLPVFSSFKFQVSSFKFQVSSFKFYIQKLETSYFDFLNYYFKL